MKTASQAGAVNSGSAAVHAGAAQGTASTAAEWRQHWGVVLAGFVGMAMAIVHIYSIGLFIGPLEEEFGWSRSEIMFGYTLYALVSALMTPLFGFLIDRFGPRRLGIVGVLTYCACLAALSLATSALWSWWILWVLLSFGAVMVKPTLWTAAVSSLFTRGRGVALAVVLCGTGIGSSFVPRLSEYFIAELGWRGAYPALAGLCLLIALPVIYCFLTSASDNARRASRQSRQSATAPAPLEGLQFREAILSAAFLKLALAGFIITIAINSFVMNLVPIMAANGIERATAASLAGLIGITAIIARLVTGHLLDRWRGNLIGGVILLFPIISCLCFIFAPGSLVAVAIGVVLLGLTLGAELDLIAYLATRYFGLRNFGAIFGCVVSILNVAAGIGPLAVSYIYDQSGSYQLALWLYIPLCVIASLAILSLGNYPDLAGKALKERERE